MRLREVPMMLLLLLCAACSQTAPASAPKPDLTAEDKAIREADAKWLKAAQSRDARAEAAVFASDGVAYREHVDPLVGPAAFESWSAKQYAENPKQTSTWSTEAIQITAAGDIAVQTGQYHLTGVGPKGDGEDSGRFVTVWKKVDGEWKVAHDIGSTTMPVPKTEKK
jgi:uncharacterized protein (TIGR02246 family)